MPTNGPSVPVGQHAAAAGHPSATAAPDSPPPPPPSSSAPSIAMEDEEASLMDDEDAGPPYSMHQPTLSPSTLDVTGATIHQAADGVVSRGKDAPCIVLPHQSDYVSHIALDIGGSLVKLVYFRMDADEAQPGGAGRAGAPPQQQRGGKLHFVKFETAKIKECVAFIKAKRLHLSADGLAGRMRIKATGGGAYKYAELFKEELGLIIEGEDEMACMVEGCNFLLNAVRHEAFQYENAQMKFVDLPTGEQYPYLLVNIGSGVSMVRVDGENKFTRVSGTNIGGGTFWGLCKLLTGMDSFNDILALSDEGDNSNVDMLVGDIYGGRDYTGIGLSANTIASSFGKVVGQHMPLEQYNPADVVQSLVRMISYNIGQLAYLNAKRYNLSRIFFGGFFIRGHPYTMETISFAIRFWSKGEMAAMFLRHEGFLGAVGAFMKVQALQTGVQLRKVRSRFVERFSMGAPLIGGEVRGPAITGLNEKINWVEKFVAVGRSAIDEAAKAEHERALEQQRQRVRRGSGTGPADVGDALAAAVAVAATRQQAAAVQQRLNFNLGVLQFTPSSEPFPLLVDAVEYNPSTIDINSDPAEMEYWIGILQASREGGRRRGRLELARADQIPQVVEKAAVSEGDTPEAQRRAAACGRALDLHLSRLRSKPGAYGQLGLADLFELREECLREFGFSDVYRKDKERENSAALEVLPDLLAEIDEMAPPARLLALVQGVLAANIFDWGANACVQLYQSASILEMYREARTKLSQRPWRVDDFDAFAEYWFSKSNLNEDGEGTVVSPYQRVIMFVDNAGADVVLGAIPFARELLRMGAEVVLVANSLPAINDITAAELRSVVAKAAEVCPIIRAARDAAVSAEAANHGRIPPVQGHAGPRRTPSPDSGSLGASSSLELPATRSAAGFAFSPAPRRGVPVKGSNLLSEPHLPSGSPLADALASSPASTSGLASTSGGSGGASLVGSPQRRRPLPPASQQLVQQLQRAASERQGGGGGGAAVEQAIAALEGASIRGRGADEAPPSAAGPAAAAAAAAAGGGGAADEEAGPSGSDAGSAFEERQLGGQRRRSPSVHSRRQTKGMFGESYPSPWRDPRLFIAASGHGSPCLDLRRVSSEVADAAAGTDLVVIEGMGRAVHTNYFCRLQCDALKLAMIKNKHLAQSLFKGDVYDCVCRFDEGIDGLPPEAPF
ncbi:Pantothenate kinase 2 isoform B [Micractinium conductrix]|uniref:pantothenate kinase n=1 Tax=Micractinium conductrix TaxID=554055 RepID=A0A2P6VQJ1_9CHLO|nr:Pantothenate kinase 2 isoform B [Micractinium conductrix]|eukprot:PSC76368.1 Pantothenate kinase 2 isoform B [Micractinium conductrix]